MKKETHLKSEKSKKVGLDQGIRILEAIQIIFGGLLDDDRFNVTESEMERVADALMLVAKTTKASVYNK